MASVLLDLIHFMVHNWIMIRINIHDAKTHLSRYVERLLRGEVIVLCRRNVPIAEIRPLPRPQRGKRPIGLAKGGEHIKRIASEARQDMEKLFGRKVFLHLWVKVKGGWADDARLIKQFGYE